MCGSFRQHGTELWKYMTQNTLRFVVAVAAQRAVAVDPARVRRAAVDELAHATVAAAVPGAVGLDADPVARAGELADRCAGRGGQRPALEIGQQRRRPRRRGARARRSAGRGRRPAGRRARAAAARGGRSAAARSGAGSRRSCRCGRRSGRPRRRRAGSRRRPCRRRPRPRRRRPRGRGTRAARWRAARGRAPGARGLDDRGELAPVVDGSLREHDAVAVERDSERRAGHATRGPGVGVLDLVEAPHDDAVEPVGGRRDALAQRAAGAGEEREPEVGAAVRPRRDRAVRRTSRPLASSNQRASALGSFSGGPSPSTSSAPRGALRRPADEHDDGGGDRGGDAERQAWAAAQQRQRRARARQQRGAPGRGAREPAARAEAAARRAAAAARQRDDLDDEEARQQQRAGVGGAPRSRRRGRPRAPPRPRPAPRTRARRAARALRMPRARPSCRCGLRPSARRPRAAPRRPAAMRRRRASTPEHSGGRRVAVLVREQENARGRRTGQSPHPRGNTPHKEEIPWQPNGRRCGRKCPVGRSAASRSPPACSR